VGVYFLQGFYYFFCKLDPRWQNSARIIAEKNILQKFCRKPCGNLWGAKMFCKDSSNFLQRFSARHSAI
jgi:hypothetical protein